MAEVITEGDVVQLDIDQGGSFSQTFEYFTLEDDGTRTPRPLTGYTTGKAQIRDKPGGTLLGEFTVDVEEGDEETPGAVTLSLTAAETAALSQSGMYDVALIHTNGVDVILPFIQGTAMLDQRVTVIEEGS